MENVEENAQEKLFSAFNELVDRGLENIKINKNKSKTSSDWTIQILDFKGDIIAESKSFSQNYEAKYGNSK
tara:strand:+ start:515 stop:727 length:213 start_codon:yes stop_codon:yes gene_type:complete